MIKKHLDLALENPKSVRGRFTKASCVNDGSSSPSAGCLFIYTYKIGGLCKKEGRKNHDVAFQKSEIGGRIHSAPGFLPSAGVAGASS